MMFFTPVALLVVAGVLLGYLLGRSSVRPGPSDPAALEAARRDAAQLRALVNRVKDLAWDQREVDPALSTVIIEEIREHERRELGP